MKDELRPLSIPAVRDRIVQAAVKIVFEPVFKADMLDCSFGSRPRRSAHDALQVLMDEHGRGRRWVVEPDIANCFSVIPHDELIQAIEERICDQSLLKLLRVIVRAGVTENGRVRDTDAGTPQGDLTRLVQCLPAPAGPGMGHSRWSADPVYRRSCGDVLVTQPGDAGADPADRTADRAGAGAQGGRDPHRAPGGGWGGLRLPRFSSPAGAIQRH
nr:reverse transcriptase domain-containing protein [Planobispora siamensis]